MPVKKKRITENGEVVYPIVDHSCVIGLQGQIKEKLPIVSENQPQQGFVTRQAWINIDNSEPNSENEVEINTNGIQIEHDPIVIHSQIEEEPEPTGEIEEDDLESGLAEIEEN